MISSKCNSALLKSWAHFMLCIKQIDRKLSQGTFGNLDVYMLCIKQIDRKLSQGTFGNRDVTKVHRNGKLETYNYPKEEKKHNIIDKIKTIQ